MSNYILAVLVGVAIGIVGTILVSQRFRRTDGTFRIDDRLEDRTLWKLQYDGDPTDISKKRYVTFRVEVEKDE